MVVSPKILEMWGPTNVFSFFEYYISDGGTQILTATIKFTRNVCTPKWQGIKSSLLHVITLLHTCTLMHRGDGDHQTFRKHTKKSLEHTERAL